MEPTVLFKDPFELRLHRLQRLLPDPDRKGTEWPAFVDAMQAAGPREIPPIIITPDGQVMDGGWRLRAAKELEWPQIKCEVQPEERAGVLIVETLLHRKQMTRGAVVYLALRFEQEFVASSETRRLSNLRKGIKTREIPLKSPNCSNCSSETVLALCQRWGIAERTYHQARAVFQLFSKRPDLKKELEPQLLSGEKNLWNVLSAAGGADTDQSGRILGVFKAGLRSFVKYGDEWKKLSREDRKAIEAKWREDAAALPQDLRNAIADVLLEEVGA